MALKKSDLYSSLWASCDELRGGMDAGQYKDYVLFMLFIKYVTDKYGDSTDFAPPVTIPKGSSFTDMLALRGKSDIGDKINTQVIAPLVQANDRLARSDFPDFNDSNKLGEGQAKVERLTNLVNIFANPQLDFSQNRTDHDDILGDAYEYLMRHFATESGKSKGQFYTPAEVSRVIARVIGISPDNTRASTTAYDPTCGSGSLLLKVAAQAGKRITIEGQEKDVTTAGLAHMNMILHDFPTANIRAPDMPFGPRRNDGVRLSLLSGAKDPKRGLQELKRRRKHLTFTPKYAEYITGRIMASQVIHGTSIPHALPSQSRGHGQRAPCRGSAGRTGHLL